MVEVAAPPATPVVTPPAEGDWRTGISADLRQEITTLGGDKMLGDVKAKDWNEAGPIILKQWINAHKLVGQKTDGLVKIPGADAKPEELTAFHKALGVPENVAEYKLDVAEDLRSLVPVEMAQAFAPLFHKLGVPPKVAQAVIQGYAEHAQGIITKTQQGYAEGRNALKTEWGDATFQRRSVLAERAIEQLLSTEQIELFNTVGLSGHPEMLKLWAKLGEQLAEDGVIQGETVTGQTKDQLERRKMEIEADPDFANKFKNPARNSMLVKEWQDIFSRLNPEPIR